MKKRIPFVLTLIFLVILGNVFGQSQASGVVAVFNGTQSSLDKEVESKTVSFTLKKLDERSRTNFETKAKAYSNFFTIYYPTERGSKTSQVYVLTLSGKTEIKMLNRLFVAADINHIEFNGKTMDREEFFKPFMK